MIANFFQCLERNGVEYLLISGQATVLYGAATFSEDIDLWINPTVENRDRLNAVLRENGARYYKLTPPLQVEYLQSGHGFHFVLQNDCDGLVFLDVMGKPPRAGSFVDSRVTARLMETVWGKICTIGIKPLVEIKKTQRLGDYPVISRLALAWFDQPDCPKEPSDFLWALQNIFTLPELTHLFSEHPDSIGIAEQFDSDIGEYGRQILATGEASDSIERKIGDLFQARIAELQSNDRRY